MIMAIKYDSIPTIEQDLQMQGTIPSKQRAILNIMHTASVFETRINEFLSEFGLTHPQYNVLRILRGAGTPLTVAEIQSRMINRTSNVSRLIDKLKSASLVTRAECSLDRRRVDITITQKGLQKLIDVEILRKERQKDDPTLSDEELVLLNQLLDKIRVLYSLK